MRPKNHGKPQLGNGYLLDLIACVKEEPCHSGESA